MERSAAPENTEAQAEKVVTDGNKDSPDNSKGGQEASSSEFLGSNIQILDLHGQHPVIAYHGQIYRCTWTDLIGTAMFFSKAEPSTNQEALMSTDDFHLINTSRIKLIGQKAKLTGRVGRKRRREVDDELPEDVQGDMVQDEDIFQGMGKSLGNICTFNPNTNADIKRQAAFLEKLMDIKRAKGESGYVRTVFSQSKQTKIIQPRDEEMGETRRRQDIRSMAKEIEELNRKVVRGDATALMRLQDIYSSIEDDAQSFPTRQQSPAVPTQASPDAPADTPRIFEQRLAPGQ
jgi:TFIIIC subunit triple barrel domain